MEKTLFAFVVSGIEDNNCINDGQWSDWDVTDAIEVFGSGFEGQTPPEENDLTFNFIALIIQENGLNRDDIVRLFNKMVWYPHLEVNQCHCDLI